MLNPARDDYYPPIQRNPRTPLTIGRPCVFSLFVSDANLYMLNLENDQILCNRVENNDARYKYNMRNLHKSIFGSHQNILEYSFIQIINSWPRKQSERKLFQRKGVFHLVKQYFTEGVQYVNEGEIHVYMVIGKPLDFYIFNSPLELRTFRSYYGTISDDIGRIYPGSEKTFDPNTYYIIVAPCHTLFAKKVMPLITIGDDNSNEISSFLETVANNTSIAVDEHVSRQERMTTWSQPSTSQDDVYDTSTNSAELQRLDRHEMVNDLSRSSIESNRATSVLRMQSPSPMEINTETLPLNLEGNETEFIGTNEISDNINTGHIGSVFAIREDGDVESYTLIPGSTLRVVENDKVVGSFAISNNDMDPYRIDYVGEEQFIREVAMFQNGSTFETTLIVQNVLLNELLQPTRRMEEVVVKYFFEFTFKAIKTAYEKFRDMRRIPMIGSCVPAIVQLSKAEFRGVAPDIYEEQF